MIRVSALRFFLTVTPPPIWLRAAMAVALAIGLSTLWLNPREIDAAFGSVLVLQMFAASNGFVAAASRGYFDPVLVSGRRRSWIALSNLLAASWPGLMAWLVLAACASAMGQGPAVFAPRRLLALVLVSVIAWAAGLVMPRLAAGALWSMVLVTTAMSQRVWGDAFAIVQRAPGGAADVAISAAACAVCPFLLLGSLPASLDFRVLAIDATVAVVVAAAGVHLVSRRQYTLTEAP